MPQSKPQPAQTALPYVHPSCARLYYGSKAGTARDLLKLLTGLAVKFLFFAAIIHVIFFFILHGK